ncbi:MAG: cryptochrome/photolyase family protein, partial [Syntrophobacterales bacterium]
MAKRDETSIRNLVIVFGDQLNENLSGLNGFDAQNDAVLMMEVEEEATYVPQHKMRLALFFSAMRHFAERLRSKGYQVFYSKLDDQNNRGSFDAEISRHVRKISPQKLVCTQPGDYRVQEKVEKVAASLDCRLTMREDNHFLMSTEEFAEFAKTRKSFLLETFYRHM